MKHLPHKAPGYGPAKTICGRVHRCLTCKYMRQICVGLLGFGHECLHRDHKERVAHNYGCDDWKARPHTGGRAKYKKSADWIFNNHNKSNRLDF